MAVKTKNLLPSNARRRREIHIANDAAIKTAKRVRRHRGRIHAAFAEAAQLVELSMIPTVVDGKVKATDVKIVGAGWPIVSEKNDAVVDYQGSRDKARARAKGHNSGVDLIWDTSVTPITHDKAMLKLGWERVQPNKGFSGSRMSRPVDEKYEWVGMPA